MKNRSFKKIKGEDNPEEKKVKEEKRFVRREKKEVVQKRKRKNIHFLKKMQKEREDENIVCPKREDTFFQRKGCQLKIKTEKTFLGFFKERVTKKKKTCFSTFPSSFGRKKRN